MTASKLRALPVLTAAALVATSCIVVEDFEGYTPLPKKQDGPPAPCAVVPCGGGNTSACQPVVLDEAFPVGALSSDLQSLVSRQYILMVEKNTIHRIAKPGCSVPRLTLDGILPEWGVVDHDYFAWTVRGEGDTCLGSSLRFCDPRNCQETNVPVLAGLNMAFEKVAGIALGDDMLYFMLTDGLVGRVPRGGTEFEEIWIDKGDMVAGNAPLLYNVKLFDNRLYFTRYAIGLDKDNECDSGEVPTTGAVFTLDPEPGASATKLVDNVNQATTIAVSNDYVFYFSYGTTSIMWRVPRGGGVAEPLPYGGEFVQAPNDVPPLEGAPPIVVHGDWVYFGAATPNGGQAIARLPATAKGAWDAASAEILARPEGWFDFVVDDEALYWAECGAGILNCQKGRLMGLALPPP